MTDALFPRLAIIGIGLIGSSIARAARLNGLVDEIAISDLSPVILKRAEELALGDSYHAAAGDAVADADLVIGTVLIPGAKAPKLVTNDMVAQMKPGSVLVDVAIDQGGCFEDSHPTTHADPTFRVHNSVFYCVANMPGAVPNTSTWGLTNATLPYSVHLAGKGWRQACAESKALALGLHTVGGAVTRKGVGDAFSDLPEASLRDVLD